jgi:hypothetical protein
MQFISTASVTIENINVTIDTFAKFVLQCGEKYIMHACTIAATTIVFQLTSIPKLLQYINYRASTEILVKNTPGPCKNLLS